MSNRLTNVIASCLLLFIFVVAVFSMKDDSLTMDELSHLPAGYSYLTQKDMRINPEHPPMIKDLAAIPLLFINGSAISPQRGINFPSESKDWKEEINGQWGFGYQLLYNSGNPLDKMIFWGRIPMIFILLLLGFYIFKWMKESFGNKTALLALFLFSFSPTFLAHGRLVTTDVGAAAGAFIATYYFVGAIKNPTKKNIVLSGIFFGIAELLKFSLILLVPLFIFLGFVWWLLKAGKLLHTLKLVVSVFCIGYLLLWPVYQYHVWNYPPERQASDTKYLLSSFGSRFAADSTVWLADKPVLRPYAQYMLGLFMVLQRASGGNTTYFLGEISKVGWKRYFPIVYAIKEPLPFHILTIISLLYAAFLLKKPFWRDTLPRTKEWLKSHFAEFAMLMFILLYWATSLKSNLNIGVRHLLPVIPFTIVLVSIMTVKLLKEPYIKLKYAALGILIIWQMASVISVYPHFLAYFNELAGGPTQGYIYTVDSNLDWGQDLKRLKKWVDANNIDNIYVDYFGGGNAKYYLKEKFWPWWGTRSPNDIADGDYLAVSATFLQGGRGTAVPGFNEPVGFYRWLDNQELVQKIGHSIFVYRIHK